MINQTASFLSSPESLEVGAERQEAGTVTQHQVRVAKSLSGWL